MEELREPFPRQELIMATLYLLNDEGVTAEQWEIGSRPITVGRSVNADVKIEDDGLSRRHFMIVQDGGDYLIRDLGSRNGTWVEGNRAFTARLRHDDFIQAGRSRFRFDLHASAAPNCSRPQAGPHGTVILAGWLAPDSRRPEEALSRQ